MAGVARPLSRVAFVLLVLAVAAVPFLANAQGRPACSPSTGKGPNYSEQDLRNRNFTAYAPGSLRGANFSKAKLQGAVFARQDLTNARFDDADLGPGKRAVDFTEAILTNTCFIGARLDATDFTFAVITCADFTETSLLDATFGPSQDIRDGPGCRTRFVHATLNVQAIAPENWRRTDFTRADFRNVSSATFNLIGQDISGAMLAQTSLPDIDMTGANLTDVDLTGATLTNATLDSTALNNAKLRYVKAESASFVCASAYGVAGDAKLPNEEPCPTRPRTAKPDIGVDFTGATLSGSDFTVAMLDHAKLSGATLLSARLTGASLAQADLTAQADAQATIVQGATFDHVNFDNAGLSGVEFDGTSLVGANFDNTTLNGTTFIGATMPEAHFDSAKLESVKFRGAILQSAKFTNTKILRQQRGGGNNTFQCAQLGGANFTGATVEAASFANAVMPGLEGDCCPGSSGPWCGIVDATQNTYERTIYPVIGPAANVACPNGDTGQCTGTQWHIKNWTTSACSDPPRPETMWSRPQCDGEVSPTVTFKDQALEKCILATLKEGPHVRVATAQRIVQVDCPGRGITDITGLQSFVRLNKLNLAGNKLTTFSLAFKVGDTDVPSDLKSLNLSDNQLKTLDIQNHPGVLFLYASDNQLTSVTASVNFAPFIVDLSHNKLKTFNLGVQDDLVWADLSYNELTSVTGKSGNLQRLERATYIDLSHNGLADIGPVSGLVANSRTGKGSLRSLFLACNPEFVCSSLGVTDGSTYPAAATSQCLTYDAADSKWILQSRPLCPPGSASAKKRRTR